MKTRLNLGCFILLLVALSLTFSCRKDFSRQAAVVTNGFDKPTGTASGKIIDMGKGSITDHGFCWDTLGFPSHSSQLKNLGQAAQTGNYQAVIDSLKPNKVYYIKAYVLINGSPEYGELLSFLTPDLPTVITDTIYNITDSSAVSEGHITADGGAAVISRGTCWGKNPAPDISGEHSSDGTGIGKYTSMLAKLNAGSKYYVRAYVKNRYGIRYGQELSFNTGQTSTIPIVSTSDVTSIQINSAISGGNVQSDGGAEVTSRGICWSKNPYPAISDNKTTDGSGIGAFTSNLSGLTVNTKYYIRAWATNSIGIAYGEEKSFTSSPNPGISTVTTSAVTGITATSASSGGVVLDDGGASVTERGVCWSTNPSPATTDNKTTDGSGTGSFSSQITGLNNGTKYYVRAYALNYMGTAYGNEISFTAGQSITSPTVTTTEVVNISQTTAGCGGNVTSDGGASVTARGVCWGIFENPTITNSHTTDGSGTGGFLSSVNGLFSFVTYYIRAYATNSAGTSYGNTRIFTTLQEATIASVTTAPITNISNNSASSGGTVTNDGGAAVSERGVCWSTGYNPTISDPHTINGSGTGGFTSQITSLQSNTFYRVRAYATNSVGTAYGYQQTFSTLQDPILPTVTTTQPLNITQTTATSGGTVMSDGGSTVSVRGVCWSTSSNPTTANSHTLDGTGTGSFVCNITGLSAGTQYYVRAYATNGVGTTYGNECIFITQSSAALPTITTTAATNIAQTTASSGGNVTSDGGSSVTARGVCWSTSSNPTTTNSHTTDGSGTGSFVSNITGLSANTLYYVRAYATNGVGTAYGNEVTFTTLSNPVLPTITTTAVTTITQNTAISGGNVTNDGGVTVTSRGICWNTSINPTIANSHTTDGSGTGTFTSNLTGLNANTFYYVRAYATNSVGTVYGNEVNFTTTSFAIGQSYGGGIIFYLDGTGQHGLISSTIDQSSGEQWGCNATTLGTSTAIGTGQANTTAIVNCLQSGSNAAKLCNDLILNGYNDWFLPSLDELSLMFTNKNSIGGFTTTSYWSSSENYSEWAHNVEFANGTVTSSYRYTNKYVRAVRAF